MYDVKKLNNENILEIFRNDGFTTNGKESLFKVFNAPLDFILKQPLMLQTILLKSLLSSNNNHQFIGQFLTNDLLNFDKCIFVKLKESFKDDFEFKSINEILSEENIDKKQIGEYFYYSKIISKKNNIDYGITIVTKRLFKNFVSFYISIIDFDYKFFYPVKKILQKKTMTLSEEKLNEYYNQSIQYIKKNNFPILNIINTKINLKDIDNILSSLYKSKIIRKQTIGRIKSNFLFFNILNNQKELNNQINKNKILPSIINNIKDLLMYIFYFELENFSNKFYFFIKNHKKITNILIDYVK